MLEGIFEALNINGVIGLTGVALSLTVFFVLYRKIGSLKSDLNDIAKHQRELMNIEERVMEKDPEYEDFEETVSNLSERLFSLIKSKYDLEGVTTYEEMIEELDGTDQGDDDTREDLIKFFNYIEDLEYGTGELSEEDKAMIRQSAFNLLRKAGPSLEEAIDHKEEE